MKNKSNFIDSVEANRNIVVSQQYAIDEFFEILLCLRIDDLYFVDIIWTIENVIFLENYVANDRRYILKIIEKYLRNQSNFIESL